MFKVVSNTSTSYTQAYLYDIARGYKRSGLSEGKFGTICLPYNVETAEWSGATFYEIVGKKTLDGMVISLSLRKVSALVAGCPYIFKAENENKPYYNNTLCVRGGCVRTVHDDEKSCAYPCSYTSYRTVLCRNLSDERCGT